MFSHHPTKHTLLLLHLLLLPPRHALDRSAHTVNRYQKLCDMWGPPSKVPAWLNVTDIAGLVAGASEGAGLGNAFLSHIQAVDGIYHVVRAFDNDEIVHVDDSIDPIRDLNTIQHELCAKDLIAYDAAIVAEDLAVKKSQGKMKLSPLYKTTMEKVGDALKNDIPLHGMSWTEGTEGQLMVTRGHTDGVHRPVPPMPGVHPVSVLSMRSHSTLWNLFLC